MIRIWKSFHSKDLERAVALAWEKNELLILVPPMLKDFSFVRWLPPGEISIEGDWCGQAVENLRAAARLPRKDFGSMEVPVLGVFSSGTTSGAPRLVLYSRRNVQSSLEGILHFFERERISSIFCYPQPFHTFGLTLGYVLSLLCRVPLLQPEGRYTRAFHEKWLAEVNAGTLTLGTPTHFRDLLSAVEASGARPKPSYSAIIGGAKATVALWVALRDRLGIEKPSIGYGATEACPGVTHLPPGQMPREDGEIGVPIPTLKRVEILRGEGVLFGGPSACMAMSVDGELVFPSSVVIRDDVERRDSDGIWLFRGRTDLVLNRGGQKFQLERIEELLLSRFGLEAVCVPVPDERLGEELGIVIRKAGEKSALPDPQKVLGILGEELGVTLNARHWVEVAEFPLNSSLKVDRKACAALFAISPFPVDVEKLKEWLPHRHPAVWVDQVLSLGRQGEDSGECGVLLSAKANYVSGDRIRPTAYVEWMAQSFGYIKACETFLRRPSGAVADAPARAFLAAVKDFNVERELVDVSRHEGKRLVIQVKRTHQLGPIALVTGSVKDWDGRLLARAELKLFSD